MRYGGVEGSVCRNGQVVHLLVRKDYLWKRQAIIVRNCHPTSIHSNIYTVVGAGIDTNRCNKLAPKCRDPNRCPCETSVLATIEARTDIALTSIQRRKDNLVITRVDAERSDFGGRNIVGEGQPGVSCIC